MKDKEAVVEAIGQIKCLRATRFDSIFSGEVGAARQLRMMTGEPEYLFGLVGCPNTKFMTRPVAQLVVGNETWFAIENFKTPEHQMVWLTKFAQSHQFKDWWTVFYLNTSQHITITLRNEIDAMAVSLMLGAVYQPMRI